MGINSMGVDEGSAATEPKRPEASLGELLGEMSSELGTLFRQEVQLAKTEAKEEVARAGKAAGMLGGAGAAAWIAAVVLSLALAWLLDQAINRALAFAIVGTAWAIAAAVLTMRGRQQMRAVEVLPVTKETLKEDVQWAKAQKT